MIDKIRMSHKFMFDFLHLGNHQNGCMALELKIDISNENLSFNNFFSPVAFAHMYGSSE